mgnify:CR=1 FL=1
MKKLISKPHLFFFGLIPVAIIIALLLKNEEIVFSYYGANIVVQLKFIYYLSAFFFCLLGFNYFSLYWANKTPKKKLTIIHIILQVVSFILLITYKNWSWLSSANQTNENFMIDNSNFILFISFLFFLLATFFHLINFFLSLFSKSK